MSQASIIINVSNQSQSHSNGLSGIWTVPGRKEKEEFGMLVVYPAPEIQDIGDQRRVVHWLKARPLALDICGLRSDASAHGVGVKGDKEKWGLLICEAEPDVPRYLQDAVETEMEFLDRNPPDVRYKRDPETKANVAINIYEPGIREKHEELSLAVQEARERFENECRRLVQKKEVQRAKKNLLVEDQRLVGEADRMWARPTEQHNINELHRMACQRMGQERPWCYVPQQLIDCPGCGAKIKENILQCPNCHGLFDDEIEKIRLLPPRERSIRMYPERVAT